MRRNPKLVYGRMTGWGQDGPLAPTAGHDITYLAITGLLHGIGPADGPPVPPVNYVADFGGGAMFLVTGLLAALLHARATGEGQVVDAAMTEGAGLPRLDDAHVPRDAAAGRTSAAANLLDGGAPNYRCYECADGRYVAVGALEPQFWAALVDGPRPRPTAPSPYDPAQWARVRRRCSPRPSRPAPATSGPSSSPHRRLRRAGAHPRGGAEHPHNVARRSYTSVGDATMVDAAPKFSATAGRAGT